MLLAAATVAAASQPAVAQNRLKEHETRYYVIHSDLDGDALAEAEARINCMAEMYYARTKAFGGKITRKLPFYLFSRPADYYAAGGTPGSAGVFTGDRMMAIVGVRAGEASWHVVQHEAFHQFVHAFIGGGIPIWVNEGLAEYFGQAIYTGDGFIEGVIPPERLARLKQLIAQKRTKPINEMMLTTHATWNVGLSVVNYDQAWSMVHFLAHANGGRYQGAFNGFIGDVARGMRWERAWKRNFGTGTREFENKWRSYWTEMPAGASNVLYAKATVATLTSFVARAASQRQTFASFSDFEQTARAGKLMSHRKDWLPPALLNDALERAGKFGKWELRRRAGRFQVVCLLSDGTTLTGTFTLANRRVQRGSVAVSVRTSRRGP